MSDETFNISTFLRRKLIHMRRLLSLFLIASSAASSFVLSSHNLDPRDESFSAGAFASYMVSFGWGMMSWRLHRPLHRHHFDHLLGSFGFFFGWSCITLLLLRLRKRSSCVVPLSCIFLFFIPRHRSANVHLLDSIDFFSCSSCFLYVYLRLRRAMLLTSYHKGTLFNSSPVSSDLDPDPPESIFWVSELEMVCICGFSLLVQLLFPSLKITADDRHTLTFHIVSMIELNPLRWWKTIMFIPSQCSLHLHHDRCASW